MRYRGAYLDYADVLWRIFRRRFPLQARLRDGTILQLRNHAEAFNVSVYTGLGWSIGQEARTVTIPGRDRLPQLVFRGAWEDGDLLGVFFREEYARLAVEHRTVIDVGASIGDSALYFSARGAARVVGFEPFSVASRFAKSNIELNGFSGRAEIRRVACGPRDGMVLLDEAAVGTTAASSETRPGRLETEVLSLNTIMNSLDVTDAVLKLDVEGREYGIIEATDNEVLRRFSQICIEYHHGLQALVSRLRAVGFNIRYTRPRHERRPRGDVGLLLANRPSKS